MACPGVGRRRGWERVCAGFVRKHITFWDEVILQEHSVRDELISYKLVFGTWNKQYRSTRYILRRPLLLFQGELIKRVTVLLRGRKNRLIRTDLPHPPGLHLVHATGMEKFKESLGETTTPVR